MKSSRQILAVCLTTALAMPLSACSPLDVFGPRANGTIMKLAKQASADKVFGDGEWSELRAFHAEQLKDEARRLCGTNDAGEVPPSCDVTYGDTDLPGDTNARALVSLTAEAADKVPDESRALVVAQAIDAATTAKLGIEDPTPIDEKDTDALEAAKQLISAEYAVEYGLDIASAYADDQLQGRIDHLRTLHDARLAVLHHAFPAAELPAREAGYEIPQGAPTTTADAVAFVDTLEKDLIDRWRAAAATADSPEWRELAILLAGHAQRAA